MIKKINRIIRSVIYLNRYIEFKTIVKMLDLNHEDILLDIGSGDGYWTNKFSALVKEVIGVDPTNELLNLSMENYKNPNLKFTFGKAEDLKFKDMSFSKVTSISTVEHFQDPIKGLSEMGRVLQKNGILSISVDSLSNENSKENFIKWHRKKHFVTKYFTNSEITKILNDIDLIVDEKSTIGLFKCKASCRLREFFIKNTLLLTPIFPLFYFLCRISDKFYIGGEVPPQILIVKAMKV